MSDLSKIKRLLERPFEVELFEASIANLNNRENVLRYNNFAYSIRELSRHFLERLAPDEKVKNCSWFRIETKDGRPTRAQRIKYAIQGGIIDEQLEEWGFDIIDLNDTIKEIKGTIDSLSRYTHINPEVFNLKDVEIEKYSKKVFNAFDDFIFAIDNYKENLKTFLDGHIEGHMISSVVSNSFINVDSLAHHYSLNDSEVIDYEVFEINDYEIVVNVNGILYVTLEYGSRAERREGDGLDLDTNFPFETKIRYDISYGFPSERYEVDEYDVDTSAWYEEDNDVLE